MTQQNSASFIQPEREIFWAYIPDPLDLFDQLLMMMVMMTSYHILSAYYVACALKKKWITSFNP